MCNALGKLSWLLLFLFHSQLSFAQTETVKPVPLLKDPGFEKGLLFLKPKQGMRIESGSVRTLTETVNPLWEVAQWGSRFDLAKGIRTKNKKGVHFADSAKSVSIYEGNRFSLRINGAVEYGKRPRRFFEPWPHLYLAQNFEPDMFVSRFSAIPFHIEGKHLFTRNYLGKDMKDNLHTSQLIIQFFLQNKNKTSPGYNKEKIILSLPVYDYRWDYRSETAFLDAGTKKTVTNTFVYGPGGQALWSGSFRNDTTNWHTMNCDLLPHLWEAFRAGKKEGYLKNSQFEDLALTSFVFGWEMPGTFDSEMEFRNMQLTGIPQPASLQKPNIALIIADDLNWDDLGCYGNGDIKTPNIDQLARSGIRFRNAYVTASSCSPSRISILTGRYPHNTGAAELHTEAPASLVYFPELMRKAGYYTGLSGKFHEGKNTRRAYDTLFVNREQNGPGGEATWLSLLNSRDDTKPFFFWLSAVDPHRNWQLNASEKVHNPQTISLPAYLNDDSSTRKDLAAYYDEVARLDRFVGAFIQRLKELGIYENTVIVFLSDNGRSFPGSKGHLTDQGVKTPLIVSWPAGLKNTSVVSDALVSSIDIAPTLLQLAGGETASDFQGMSFSYLLNNPGASFRNYIFCEQNWHDFEGYQRMVRDKQYMYIVNKRADRPVYGPLDVVTSPSFIQLRDRLGTGKLNDNDLQRYLFQLPSAEVLYDLSADAYQIKNLVADSFYARKLERLRSVMVQWQKRTADTEPLQLTADWYDVKNGQKLPGHGIRGEMPGTGKNAVSVKDKGPF